MIREWGAKGLQVEELYGLDEGFLRDLHPIYGLILLFKWDSQLETKRAKSISPLAELGPKIYFARQTVQNACATQALLSILFNIPPECNVDLGDDLENLRDFSRELDPEMRGEAIGACEQIKRVHNSFSKPELGMLQVNDEDEVGNDKEDPFHFVSFLPLGDTLYEFDGLKAAPTSHGTFEEGNWSQLALHVIQQRIAAFHASAGAAEIRFNLMALIRDRTLVYQEALERNIEMISRLESSRETTSDHRQQLGALQAQNVELELRLQEEQDKMTRYQRENSLRRHNLISLALEMVKQMGKHGMLDELC